MKKYWDLYDPDKIPPVTVPDRPTGAPDFAVKQGAGELKQYVAEIAKTSVRNGQTSELSASSATAVVVAL